VSGGRPISEKARQTFLDALRLSPNVTAAAAAAGHNRRAFYRVRNRDREFAEAWDEVLEEALDRLEAAMYRYGTEGYEERVYDAQGNLVSRRVREDPASARALLAAHRPALWSERHRLEVGGSIDVEHQLAGGPVISIGEVIRRHRELEAGAAPIHEGEAELVDDVAIDETTEGDA
jgi:hypothetical protein